jgi:hypothetical protein
VVTGSPDGMGPVFRELPDPCNRPKTGRKIDSSLEFARFSVDKLNHIIWIRADPRSKRTGANGRRIGSGIELSGEYQGRRPGVDSRVRGGSLRKALFRSWIIMSNWLYRTTLCPCKPTIDRSRRPRNGRAVRSCRCHPRFDRLGTRGEAARRFPGPGRQIDESMAVAIDGETYLAQLKPESETT